jgi:hypothetical protein
MTAAVMALGLAVFTVVAYATLSERLDYASVRRRQLDLWAVATAFGCFGAIVYGGVATTSQSVRPAPQATAVPGQRPELPAGGPEHDAAPAPAPGVMAAAPVQLLAPPPAPVPADPLLGPAPASDAAPAAPVADEPELGDAAAGATATAFGPAAYSTVQVTLVSPTVPVVALLPGPTRTPAPEPTAAAALPTRNVPPRIAPTRTPAPAQPTPTEGWEPLPSSTPSCGEPALGQLDMDDFSASADRDGADLVVHFHARVRNGASFPLTLSDISAAALNQTAGSEQYGHARLSDIAVEPGAVIDLEGAVELSKLPPPFGRTELCVSFALDSCGQRADRTVRQCATVHGF